MGFLALGMETARAQNLNTVQVLSNNDSGMHCLDSDYSIYQILPPGNRQRAQVVGKATTAGTTPRILTNTEASVFYRAVADPNGSINTTSVGKTNFWSFVTALFGIALPPNTGFQGQRMPGLANNPQLFSAYDAASKRFGAPGIPITPYNDAGQLRPYPLLQIQARDPGGALLGELSSVTPVSNETHCRACHATGRVAAKPGFRGVRNYSTAADIDRQTRINVLLLHDAVFGTNLNASRPVNCSQCHYSAANDVLVNGQVTTTNLNPPDSLSAVMHTRHGRAINGKVPIPDVGIATCYRCHPGQTTKCYRGAMFEAGLVCQNCHGNLLSVGGRFPLKTTGVRRRPWIDLPTCASCHTGDVLSHKGSQVILRLAYAPNDRSATPRQAVNQRFAEQAGVLYMDSLGHQGIACESCHGSPHAIWPTNQANDNIAATQIQGHSGMISECSACHADTLAPNLDGPHGMHPVNDLRWIDEHSGFFRTDANNCKTCHGKLLEGAVLSKAAVLRRYSLERSTVTIRKGREVGCSLCHGNPL